ncbi:MAG: hypothetical protein NXI22_02515 [bacterium]|nr:hypothetical protein [bacterium]
MTVCGFAFAFNATDCHLQFLAKQMLRYSPPKSSVWGHTMKRKPPQEFRECVVAFLEEAAGKYTATCQLITNAGDAFVESLRAETKISATSHRLRTHGTISESEFEACLDWIVANPNKVPGIKDGFVFNLSRYFHIDFWKCAEHEGSANLSTLVEGYGTLQHLGTQLIFSDADEYHQIKALVKRFFGLQLNDKHVRPKGALG